MPRRKASSTPATQDDKITDYRYDQKRKHIPPAGLAAQGRVRETPKVRYEYDPHLPPVLRFDASGAADRLPELLQAARQRALTADEARLLADSLRVREPWLEWAGKREQKWFEVDPVALHIHERVSAQAVMKLAAREPVQRSLYSDPELEYREAVRFYQHDVEWANRLILGDSLMVMSSLAHREDLAGKVQMIYMDPPYGIKFASNFQSQVGRRDVKDREEDLTREPEVVKAYRDTWTLGVHSYLAYLRDRLVVAKGLLADTGSIFVQISDENLHHVREIMDEVFGADNFCAVITVWKTSSATAVRLASTSDYLLWYAHSIDQVKYRQLYTVKDPQNPDSGGAEYKFLMLPNGERQSPSEFDQNDLKGGQLFRPSPTTSQSGTEATRQPVEYEGREFVPGPGGWKTNAEGFRRLAGSGRLLSRDRSISFVRYLDDFNVVPVANLWTDVRWGFDAAAKRYVVETNPRAIQRCLLMTTDPGDLVLDPTCGSGTTAYVAEQWGRRWITIDTSRVAIALARQRLLTAKYDYYAVRDGDQHTVEAGESPQGGFVYKSVPHITLKSIAQNQALDPIFARWEPVLAERLAALNAALSSVTPAIRTQLQAKLTAKERTQGKSAITDADRRRWLLPQADKGWQEWEVPFDTDPDWPSALADALTAYRQAWRGKMDEVNKTIADSAEQEELVDQPQVVRGVLRVSGPFTVEGVQPAEESLDLDSPINGEPEPMPTFEPEPTNAEAYLEKMVRLLRQDGVRFPDNKVQKFSKLDPLSHSLLHAEGEWSSTGAEEREDVRRVAVTFGPQYGPITAKQVEDCIRLARRRGFDDLVFAGFTIDGAAQAVIQEDPDPDLRVHLAHIRPDVAMGDLLKDTPGSQLFTVSGLPRVRLEPAADGEVVVVMEGVDIYDPVTNTIIATNADKVAAWFIDGDYDGRTFCITQAFFPDSSAWDKLARSLKGVVDEERFAAFSGTRSLPFAPGPHGRVAVKVIDPRGNEVMRVMGVGAMQY